MNAEILRGRWQQLKGRVKLRWAQLTEDELKEIDGNLDILAGKLLERYGHQRENVENALDELDRERDVQREKELDAAP